MKLRLIILTLTLMALAAFTAGAYAYYRAMKAAVLADTEVRMTAEASAIASRIANALRENLKTARTLAGLPAVVDPLEAPSTERIRAAEALLAHFQQNLEVSVCYLMNAEGLTLAASNSQDPISFVGQNYAFRPYFQQAMRGIPWVHLAVGVTSGVRGIYSSHPVQQAGAPSPSGVLVIKSAMEPVEDAISRAFSVDWALVDPEGVVFAGSRPEWRQHRIWNEAGTPDNPGAPSRDAPHDGLQPAGDGWAAGPDGRRYLVHRAPVPDFAAWQIITFGDRDQILAGLDSPIFDERRAVLILATLVFASLIGALYAVAREDMRQRQDAHAALGRHNAYMEALHEATLGLLGRMTRDELIESVLNRAGALAGTRNGFLFLYNADAQVLELQVGLGAFHQAVGVQVRPGEGLVGRIFVSDAPLMIPDYARWEERLEDSRFASLRAVMGFPLKREDQIVGVMGLAHLTPEKAFGPEEQNALMRLAELATIVLDNATLYQRLQQELKERQHDQEALELANAELQRLAVIDGLTEVANRRHFDAHLESEFRRMRRHRQPLSLLLCDVDHFKDFNDARGHLAGDDCLREVARAMAAHGRRPGDLVARYGGEEFAVILSRTDAAGARQVGERIRRAVEALGIAHPASPTARHVTVSLGGASLVIDAETAPADLIAAADQALYAAKHTGRNRVVVETE
jgi:diguanylate cyclase (GGDEF)-like protein